jgi:hypothetical protein
LITDTQNGLFVLQPTVTFPVTLTDFAANLEQGKVSLHWATQSESNNAGFLVERSADGDKYESIAQVAGAGRSDQRLEYATYDPHPLEGTNYYRLKQTDFDGNFKYSEVEVVEFGTSKPEMLVYPSPSRAGELVKVEINAQVPATIDLGLYDIMGRRVLSKQVNVVPGEQVVNLGAASEWTPGTYTIRLQGEGWNETRNLQVMN